MPQSPFEAFSLEGRIAVVTGAGSGIGRETAIVLAGAGAKVVLADLNEAGLQETAMAIGSAATAHRIDVSLRADVDALAERTLARAGRIDVWANIAGTTSPCGLLDATEELVDRIIAINMKGVYWGCIAAARAMQAQGAGSIINMSSTGATSAPPGMSIYAMTKAGVNAVTRSVAKEMGPFGIRANSISPGFVETPLASWSYRDSDGRIDEELREQALRLRRAGSPLGITGEPSDIAYAVLYLASDASRFVTGQNLFVNGGVTMG